MNNNTSLYNRERVEPTPVTRKYILNKNVKVYQVYRIPLSYLYYNDKNDRIATDMAQYSIEHGAIVSRHANLEEYNNIIEQFIEDSNPEAMAKTFKSIEENGQIEPGVVLADGRVIDGNRRFTCLRKLQRKTNEEQFFEASIIDKCYEDDEKAIKTLELSIQIAKELPVDYNPIDRLVGIYRDIVENAMFTPEEYAKATGVKVTEVKTNLEKARYMREFLEFINEPNAYHIAKTMKLDGPLSEMPGIMNACKNSEYKEDLKNRIFADILMGIDGDMTRFVRKYKNLAKNPDELEKFLNDGEETVQDVVDIVESTPITSIKTITEEVRGNNEEIADKLKHDANRAFEAAENGTKKTLPVKQAKDALDKLDSIRTIMIPKMEELDKTEFKTLLNKLAVKLEELRNIVEP